MYRRYLSCHITDLVWNDVSSCGFGSENKMVALELHLNCTWEVCIRGYEGGAIKNWRTRTYAPCTRQPKIGSSEPNSQVGRTPSYITSSHVIWNLISGTGKNGPCWKYCIHIFACAHSPAAHFHADSHPSYFQFSQSCCVWREGALTFIYHRGFSSRYWDLMDRRHARAEFQQ